MTTRLQLRPRSLSSLPLALVLLLVATLFLAACGGGGDNRESSEANDAETVEASGSSRTAPTMPVAQFAAVAADVDLTKVAESEAAGTPEPDEPDMALGADAYARLCADCHGDVGQGVADKGETVVGMELDAAAFLDLVRTGGDYGNEHIFAPIKISDDGITALFAYVQTLSEQ